MHARQLLHPAAPAFGKACFEAQLAAPALHAFEAAIRNPRAVAHWLPLGGVAFGCAMLGPAHGSPSAAVMAVVFLAALLSSIAGFAFSAICGAMLFRWAGDPVQLVQIMLACSIANQALMAWSLRCHVAWRGLRVCLLGGMLGLPLGLWALLHVDHGLYTHALGVLLLAFGAYLLVRRQRVTCRQRPCLDLAAGVLGGITGGAAGFPSAPVAIWCSLKGWDSTRQRALCQPFTLIIQAAALLAISVTTQGADGFSPGNLLCVPASLLGTSLAMTCSRRLSDRGQVLAVNLLLIASGLSFVL